MARGSASVRTLVVVALVLGTGITAGHAQQGRSPLPGEPLGATDEAIYPAFEGWGELRDGTTVLLLGYYNRNRFAPVDIPIGPNNRIEPGGPDLGQPTHFEVGRQWGVFAIPVSKDFDGRKLTWTLVANGQTTAVNLSMNPHYHLDFFKNAANGNEPPLLRFAVDGRPLSGPPAGIAQTLAATVGQALPLTLWASDPPTLMADIESELSARTRAQPGPDDPVAIVDGQELGGPRRPRPARRPAADITVNWRVHRGPGPVTFAPESVPLATAGSATVVVEATAHALFTTKGDYVLRAQVNDTSGDGGGGLQCCWTNAFVNVAVK